ncbi:sensor histidine kinase [Lutibacter flavus]|uniref:histidine kinase n=1 Tax=Lutibacter flavus TaxID=691689 RepID=A0A238VN68_9FLAO|nr:ATP-binding protein [Lutibacter flavus]SNR35614.1 hypothetical protein SAMN04488111_0744 [Lutibacter flavus]
MFLKDKKAFYKVCFDSMQVGILVWNSEKEIVLANIPTSKIFNYSVDELFTQNAGELFKNSRILNEFIKNPDKNKFKIPIEGLGVTKEGKEVSLELSFGKLEYEKKIYFKALISDITSRKKKELKIDNLNYQLEEEVKLRNIELESVIEKLKTSLNKEIELNNLKTKFITLASHEFKTPLSAILTSAELIVKYSDLENATKRDEHLVKVKAMINHLNGMVDSLLTLENIESGNIIPTYTKFKFGDLINRIIANAKPLLQKNQKIIFNKDNDEIIYQDSNILNIIITNLLYNAIKYSKENSIIKVKSSFNKGNIYISLGDNGIGIPSNEQNLIFKRFFRAKNVSYYPGTGIGLNIVNGYVKCLNGAISFKSKENLGTVFNIQIPKIRNYE